MKAVVLAGLGTALAAAVLTFAFGLVLPGYAAVTIGVLWLALASGQARPSRWQPAEIEPRQWGNHD